MTSETGTSPRRSGGMRTACLTWTMPTTSSARSPRTGKRENPVERASSMTLITGSVARMASIRVRGVMISSARRSPNASDRCSSVAVSGASVPCCAERPTSDISSSGERADASSSWGSMPIRRRIPFADSLKSAIAGRFTVVNPRMNPWTALAVCSGSATARFWGTSSPRTIVTAVARISAIVTATPWTAPDGTPRLSSGPSMSFAIAGSARKPMSRFVIVIPSWAPESCVERLRSALSTPRAAPSPDSAARSTVDRSTVTKENSAATNAPQASTSASDTSSRRTSVTGPTSVPWRRRAAWRDYWEARRGRLRASSAPTDSTRAGVGRSVWRALGRSADGRFGPTGQTLPNSLK